ncbi:MAG: ComF family protein [Faecousia sp.]
MKPDSTGKNSRQFLDSFTAVWYYEEDVRRSILRFKFRRAVHLAPKFGALLALKLLEQGPEQVDVLTWVPVSTLRRFHRGYDQCQLLTRAVGEELGIQPQKTLRKIRNNPPQSGLTSVLARKANVLGAYKVVKNADLRGKRVLLVDDIFTSGATMNECARMLLTAGAKEVHGAAIAAVRHQK